MTFELNLKEVRKKGKLISWRRAFQAEGRAGVRPWSGAKSRCWRSDEGVREAGAERRR